ncbi:hypothetical protein DFH09DRAFT_1394912 [Mycena vulgaris]|nr:hypothetical protein DFH09DRAFT_1394912 [Mycena vulgaris]
MEGDLDDEHVPYLEREGASIVHADESGIISTFLRHHVVRKVIHGAEVYDGSGWGHSWEWYNGPKGARHPPEPAPVGTGQHEPMLIRRRIAEEKGTKYRARANFTEEHGGKVELGLDSLRNGEEVSAMALKHSCELVRNHWGVGAQRWKERNSNSGRLGDMEPARLITRKRAWWSMERKRRRKKVCAIRENTAWGSQIKGGGH